MEQALGDGIKTPKPVEFEIATVARNSIVAAENLPVGAVITQDSLTTKRPGTGIAPKHWDRLMGKRVTVAVPKDTLHALGTFCV